LYIKGLEFFKDEGFLSCQTVGAGILCYAWQPRQ